jgi:hypothetical protein
MFLALSLYLSFSVALSLFYSSICVDVYVFTFFFVVHETSFMYCRLCTCYTCTVKWTVCTSYKALAGWGALRWPTVSRVQMTVYTSTFVHQVCFMSGIVLYVLGVRVCVCVQKSFVFSEGQLTKMSLAKRIYI